ncbi:ABC transporter transmembrane region 2, partial [Ancylostoma caninum]
MNVLQYGMAMPAISLTNAILKFGLNELKLRFRERLTKHLYAQYLKGFTFYKMSNLDNRIQNADQLLTQDVDKFCEGLVELYSNLTKVNFCPSTRLFYATTSTSADRRRAAVRVSARWFSIGFVDNIIAKYVATVVG